jgi:hypothetical protein
MMIAQATQTAAAAPLSPIGWTFMIVSVGFVVCLVVFCFYRVFTTPDNRVEEQMHAPLDINTGDRGT